MNTIENQTKSFNNLTNELQNGGLKGALSYNSLNEGNEGALQTGSGAGSFKGEVEKILLSEAGVLGESESISDILADMDIAAAYNINSIDVSRQDALVYIEMLNQNGVSNYSVTDNGNLVDAMNYKTIEVSKTLTDALCKMKNSNQAVRLDFDNNVTVVLKLSEGKLNAQFIPGDRAVEEYLRNNIPYLKQRFDEQNIPYANISYRNHRQKGNGQNNKEKNNE